MRKPDRIEQLYLDFDGFFASVEQQARPNLRGRPVGIIPFDSDTPYTCVIACSREAKEMGVRGIMNVEDAKRVCPEIILVPQSPDLYRRAHNALLAEISCVLPIEAIKSIDEITCKVELKNSYNPFELGELIKSRICDNVGKFITCSIGFAANRQLAKIACKMDKPNGLTVWFPDIMPKPLFEVELDDIPGIGRRLHKRLLRAGIYSVEHLYKLDPKQMRKLWGNVTGERLWYALHGYYIKTEGSNRSMFGHSRVLPPDSRSFDEAMACSRLLLVKASRRMRKANFYARGIFLRISARKPFRYFKSNEKRDYSWGNGLPLAYVKDELACLHALQSLWSGARLAIGKGDAIINMSVALYDLVPDNARQIDFFINDDLIRRKHEDITKCFDNLNQRYSKTIISYGMWRPPQGGYAGGKISYTRIPNADDFY